MKPIKVLYHYSSSHVDTGSPRALLRMVDCLDRARFEPVFAGHRSGSLIDEFRKRDVATVECEVESLSWRSPVTMAARVREQWRLLDGIRPAILHMNEPGWNSDIVAAARLHNIPVVLHIHNPEIVSRRNLNFALARKIFLCSAGQSAEIGHFERIGDKCVVLHNAVDIGVYSSGQSIRRAIGLGADDIVVGTIAQISHRKGIDLFVGAARRLLDEGLPVKFVIVGPRAVNEEPFFDSIMGAIHDQRLEHNVLYLGSRSDVPDVLASLDIFCLPTRAEPFGMVVIEAMAAGVPVVVSRVGGIPEIVSSPDLGRTVEPLTVDAFAAAIGEVVRMGAARKELGERGRQSLRGRFDLERLRFVLTSTYESLLSRRQPAVVGLQ